LPGPIFNPFLKKGLTQKIPFPRKGKPKSFKQQKQQKQQETIKLK